MEVVEGDPVTIASHRYDIEVISPRMDEADFARARPGLDVLSPEVIAAFKAAGSRWQRRIYATLRETAERLT